MLTLNSHNINLIDWLEKNSKPCFYKEHFNFECLGCGIQRSIIELLKGNIIDSILLFPALIPLITTLLVLVLHLKFELKYGPKLLILLFTTTLCLMLLNFIYKLTIN